MSTSKVIEFSVQRALTALAAAFAVALAFATVAQAQSAPPPGTKTVVGERYIPGISVTPDGCEVWVMDDGAEGYAVNHVRRDGTPVCRDINVCGVVNTDQFFATDSYRVSSAGRQRLTDFFQQATAFGYIIVGHTDSRASDEYNMRLSLNRANSVAKVARSSGARIIDIRGYGERHPRVPNTSAANMAKNRRVEILCVR